MRALIAGVLLSAACRDPAPRAATPGDQRAAASPATPTATQTTIDAAPGAAIDAAPACDEQCLFDKYHRAFLRGQDELTGYAMGFADWAVSGEMMIRLVTHPGPDGVFSSLGVAECSTVPAEEKTFGVVGQKPLQQPCYFSCFTSGASADELACTRAKGCAKLAEHEDTSRMVTLVPRDGCMSDARDARIPPKCARLETQREIVLGSAPCNPQQMCRDFVVLTKLDNVDPNECASLPSSATCKAVKIEYPRAACARGRVSQR